MKEVLRHSKEPFLAAGIKAGDNLSDESIKVGTVAMEDHPDFAKTIAELDLEGFTVVIHEKGTAFAYVSLQLLADEKFTIAKELHLVTGMRWLDLEHELGHIEQVMARFITQGQVLVTDSIKAGDPSHRFSFEMQNWQNYVFEFHIRLVEFLRLYHRQASDEVLVEHLKGVINYSDLFWKKSTKKWKSPSQVSWITQFFPDIFELRDEVHRIHRDKFWFVTGRVK